MSLDWLLGENLSGLLDQNIEMQPINTNFIAIPAILALFAKAPRACGIYLGTSSIK